MMAMRANIKHLLILDQGMSEWGLTHSSRLRSINSSPKVRRSELQMGGILFLHLHFEDAIWRMKMSKKWQIMWTTTKRIWLSKSLWRGCRETIGSLRQMVEVGCYSLSRNWPKASKREGSCKKRIPAKTLFLKWAALMLKKTATWKMLKQRWSGREMSWIRK